MKKTHHERLINCVKISTKRLARIINGEIVSWKKTTLARITSYEKASMKGLSFPGFSKKFQVKKMIGDDEVLGSSRLKRRVRYRSGPKQLSGYQFVRVTLPPSLSYRETSSRFSAFSQIYSSLQKNISRLSILLARSILRFST